MTSTSSTPGSGVNLPEFRLVDIDIQSPLSTGRVFFSRGMTILAFTMTALAVLPLFSVLISIVGQGLPNLNWNAIVSLPAPVGLEEDLPNGFANAILGTVIMVTLASVISIPFGVLAGIYLAEIGEGSRTAGIIRFVTKILSSVPSIVVGVFAYAVIVITTKQFSALGGGVALSVIMIPIITLTTEEALKLVPRPQRLASMALGATRFQTIARVVLAAALPGITTGVLLAVSRAAGETAPLIFTALFSETWPQGLLSPTPSLSVLIYNYALSPFVVQNNLAWTAALILLGLVLITNVLSRVATRRRG